MADVIFELDRFELGEGERLDLEGRWFGVRGRLFIRPTLTLVAGEDRRRALADLEHKPWAPEDGEPWQAAFPWKGDFKIREAELAVAPDITIRLPAPGGKARAPRRLTAVSRPSRPVIDVAPAAAAGEPEDAPAGDARPAPRSKSEDPAARLRLEVDRLRAELAGVRGELGQMATERDAATRARDELAAERDAFVAARDAAEAERQAALAERARASSDRDVALAERDQLGAGRQAAVTERDQLAAGREAALVERDTALAQYEQIVAERDAAVTHRDQALAERQELQNALARLQAERDEAVRSRGAALVMRNATRAATDPHAGWTMRSGAILLLIVVVVAVLLVTHVI